MNNKKRYHDLMERIRQSHQEFGEVWNRVRTQELRKNNVDPHGDLLISDRIEKVWEANSVAYKAALSQSNRRDEFLNILLEELPFEAFLEGNPEAIDSIIDFLEIDVRAFRCGYAKQWCYHKLKSLPLSQSQIHRLHQLTLTLCQSSGHRREFRELARLMIKLADKPLIQQLRVLTNQQNDKYTRQKAQRLLQVVLHHRPDLR